MDDLKKYETMARLDLSPAGREKAVKRLAAFEESFKSFAAIDTSGVEPLVSVLDIRNVLREDIPEKTITREELLSNAPEQYDGYFQVPKTLD